MPCRNIFNYISILKQKGPYGIAPHDSAPPPNPSCKTGQTVPCTLTDKRSIDEVAVTERTQLIYFVSFTNYIHGTLQISVSCILGCTVDGEYNVK